MKPGLVGEPFTVANRADSDGLNVMSETVFGGPTGGVLWPREMERRPPRGVRPLAWSVAKQVTPAVAPPLRTHAVSGLVLKGSASRQ
jgi:hypothetical protein